MRRSPGRWLPNRQPPTCRSYLVLLPVGFSMPPPLPAARCALTAPFHPCRPSPPWRPGRRTRLAVSFLWHCPWGRPRRALPGTVPPWSPDFPLPGRPSSRRGAESGHPAVWHMLMWAASGGGQSPFGKFDRSRQDAGRTEPSLRPRSLAGACPEGWTFLSPDPAETALAAGHCTGKRGIPRPWAWHPACAGGPVKETA